MPRSPHDKKVLQCARHLRSKGYVVLLEDIKRVALRPDVLAVHPETHKLVWVEVVNPRVRKGPLSLPAKFEAMEKRMEKVSGELVIVRLDENELMEGWA